MLRSILFWVFTWFICHTSDGQVNGLIWHQFSIDDGLSQALNAFVFKDSRGFVWIGSTSGLNRYDGTSVKVYMPDEHDPSSMLGENIQSDFFEDHRGDMWFATYDAINKYNWDHDCFDHYQVMDTTGEPRKGYYIFHQDPEQYLWLLVEFQKMYTFHVPSGTWTFKGDVDTNTIRCLPIVDQQGKLSRILMRGRDWPGIYVTDINTRKEMSPPYILSPSEEINLKDIKPVLAERDTATWLISAHGLFRYSFLTGNIDKYPAKGCASLIRLDDSLFLIGTLNAGIRTFNYRTREFIAAPENAGPRSPAGRLHKINYMRRDRDGTIWVSTDGVGIHYAHPGKNKFDFIHFPDHTSVPNDINPISLFEHEPGKLLCFTADDGVLEIIPGQAGERIKPYEPLDGLRAHRTSNVARDIEGRYWIGTWSGIFVFFPSTQELMRVTDSLTLGLTSQAAPDGRVYFTTSMTGLCVAGFGHENKPFYSVVNEIPEDEVYIPVLLDHKGRIWLSHNLKTLKVFSPETYAHITNIPVHGYCNTMIVTNDLKTIYVGASTGLYEIDEATLTLRKIHTELSGLSTTSIASILQNDQGILWLGHSKGISAFDPITGISKSYGVEDGLPPTEFTPASCRMENGLLCFASFGGIATFYPDSVRDLRTPAIPQITALEINDKSPDFTISCQKTGTTHFPAIEKLVLPYRYNTLSFNVNSLEYSAPESNTLRYTMEGLDERYITVKNGSRIRYPSMPPGDYHFVMYARNSDGMENPVPRVLELTIMSPYYRTWWFLTLSALLVFSIIAYIIYLRFSKKLELQNIRLKLYENLHDDVGSRLTAIVLSAEELEQNEKIAHPKIKAISKIARSIVGNMRRLVWAIDPENDRMTSILQKINHDKSLILDDHIDFKVDVDDRLKNIVVPGELRYQMSSVCNEAFTNIAKYAEATAVSVRVTRENKSIKLVVTDNGKGFDPEEKRKNNLEGSGYGMANMKRRASRAKGDFNVYSSPGEGTRIEFQFPFRF